MPGLLTNIKHHLPRIRLADSLIGTGLGLGLGAGAYGLRRAFGADEEDVSLPAHMLTGGLLGLGAGNLAGDRFRRYVANNAMPAGYGTVSQGQMLRPRGLEHVWNTAILDRPAKHVQEAAQAASASMPELSPFVLKARQELLRRGLGLPVREGENVFRSLGRQPYVPQRRVPHPTHGSLALDPGSGGLQGDFETLEFDPQALQGAIEAKDPGVQAMMERLPHRWRWEQQKAKGGPTRALAPGSWTKDPAAPFFARHGTETDVPGQTMTVSDLWDFALTDDENKQLKDYLHRAITDPKSLNEPVMDYVGKADRWRGDWDQVQGLGDSIKGVEVQAPNPHTGTEDTYTVPTGWEHLKILAQRKALNDLLLHRGGVAVRQKFDMSQPTPSPLWEKRQHDMSYELGRSASTLVAEQ